MRWRLGLDVGTASVGAVAIELDADGNEVGVPWHLVRIFQEPNEKGQTGLMPKKAARRQARQQRRQLERRARRLRKIAHLAPLLGLDRCGVPPSGEAGRHLPRLRARAARERIELPDVFRVFLRLAKRRGYAGGFRAVKSDKDLGVVQQGSSELRRQMNELALMSGVPFVTLGEYLQHRIECGLPSRLKIGRNDILDVFALRDMVKAEFDQIWEEQQKHHPALTGSYQDRPIKQWFAEAIFFQRPLKSVSQSVGLCPLERFLPRSPRALLLYFQSVTSTSIYRCA
jgi:CRISPR-associated endonuclease Csn1